MGKIHLFEPACRNTITTAATTTLEEIESAIAFAYFGHIKWNWFKSVMQMLIQIAHTPAQAQSHSLTCPVAL